MADIDIQEKKGSIWPWILGLLALILVAWLVMEMLDDDDDVDPVVTDAAMEPYAPPAPAVGVDAAMPAAVTQFEQQCGTATAATDEMALDHEYVETCVDHLAAAFQAVIERDTVDDQALDQQLENYRMHAAQLTENREAMDHSTHLSEVFNGAAGIVAAIEQSRQSAGAAMERRSTNVQQAAQAFSADAPLMDQRTEVHTFFREAATALRAMANNPAAM